MFKRGIEGELLAWDKQADEAAIIAQLLIMGGKLRPDFNRAAFDREIKRRRGNTMKTADGLRHLTRQLPGLKVMMIGPYASAELVDPARLRTAAMAKGVKEREIKRYLQTKGYKQSCEYLLDVMQLAKQLGRRYNEVVTDDPAPRIKRMIDAGAAAVTADAEYLGTVMLVKSLRSPAKVRAYFPDSGTHLTTITQLERDGNINLSHFGAAVYSM